MSLGLSEPRTTGGFPCLPLFPALTVTAEPAVERRDEGAQLLFRPLLSFSELPLSFSELPVRFDDLPVRIDDLLMRVPKLA